MKTENISKKEAMASAISAVHKDRIEAKKKLDDDEVVELKKEHLRQFVSRMDEVHDVLLEISEEDLGIEFEETD